MVTEVREEQPWKASSPIVLTEDGMANSSREEQLLKA
tara:strand:- start:462 stop:572 length:111 start_codon:yes stop_codon:yes gene_type:complete